MSNWDSDELADDSGDSRSGNMGGSSGRRWSRTRATGDGPDDPDPEGEEAPGDPAPELAVPVPAADAGIAPPPSVWTTAPLRPLEGDPGERTRVHVSTPDGASELCIIDRTYALLASGTGCLDVLLPPGNYQLRQQVGDEERIQPLVVPRASEPNATMAVHLEALSFPSPIPLAGNSLGNDNAAEMDDVVQAEGNFRLLVWTPASEAVKISGTSSRVSAEVSRLRLEVFQAGLTSPRIPVELLTSRTATGGLLLTATLAPGPYVLVQRGSPGHQRCLPIWIRKDLVTAIFLLALEQDGKAVPAALDHAGVVMMRLTDLSRLDDSSVYRLEAARKALAHGRSAHGWSMVKVPTMAEDRVHNWLLYLVDVILLLSSPKARQLPDNECQRLAETVDAEPGFPDAVAVRLAASAQSSIAEAAASARPPSPFPPGEGPPDIQLSGPPLLRRSWDILLRQPESNAALSRLMGLPYTVDSTGAWFAWSEPATVEETATLVLSKARQSLTDAVISAWASVSALFTKRSASTVDASWPPMREMATTALSKLTFDDWVALIVVLAESGLLQKFFDKGRELAASKGIALNDAALRRLGRALEVLRDQTLVKALNAKTLVRAALMSLGLPKEQLVSIVSSALSDVIADTGGGYNQSSNGPQEQSLKAAVWQLMEVVTHLSTLNDGARQSAAGGSLRDVRNLGLMVTGGSVRGVAPAEAPIGGPDAAKPPEGGTGEGAP